MERVIKTKIKNDRKVTLQVEKIANKKVKEEDEMRTVSKNTGRKERKEKNGEMQ